MTDAAELLAALGTVRDPELDEPVTALGFVSSCTVSAAGVVEVRLRLPTYFCAPNFAFLMVADAYDAVSGVDGVRQAEVVLEDHFAVGRHQRRGGGAGRLRPVLRRRSRRGAGRAPGRLPAQGGAGRDRPGLPAAAGRGTHSDELAGLTLGDVPPSPDLDRLRSRRAELGLFVAMPAEAAANGDYLLPTVFHSVQSDESRHISNGYATLLMALADEGNHQLLERDLRYAWWNNHRVVDAAIGTFIEYGTKDRRKDRESYAEMWRRWIYDDYYRSYLVPLEKYGLVIPHDLIRNPWNQIWNKGYVHEVAQFFCTGWLANYWRMDGMTERDFEWFEYKYPGWYDKYGAWWENYSRLAEPNGHHPIVAEDVDYPYPHRCWTCMVPCLVREDMVMAEVDGQMRTYCHEACRWTDVEAFRPTYQGRETPEHGSADRQARVGDPLPRLELGRRGLRHGLRPRRRQHPGGPAAPEPDPEEDVDSRPPAPHGAAAEPERAAQRDDAGGAEGLPRRLHPGRSGRTPAPADA